MTFVQRTTETWKCTTQIFGIVAQDLYVVGNDSWLVLFCCRLITHSSLTVMIFTSRNIILAVVLADVWQCKSQQFRKYTCQVTILLFFLPCIS